MRKETLRRIIFVSLLSLPIGILTVFLLFYGTPHLDFTTALANIEESQLQNKQLAPLGQYLQAARLANSPQQWFSLFKRLFHYQKQPKFNSYLLKLSRKAVKEMPNNQHFWAYYLSAQLWSGQAKKALPYLAKMGSAYNQLKAEILLTELAQGQNLNPNKSSIHDILVNTNANDYYQVARWLEQPRLLYNSTLFYLREGNSSKAAMIGEQLVAYGGLPQYVLGLLSYDVQRYKQAITHFLLEIDKNGQTSNWILYQLIADSYLELKDYQKAIYYYQKITQDSNSVASWQSYYNDSFANFKMGDAISAFDSLRNGIQRFPGEVRTLIRLIKLATKDYRSLVLLQLSYFRQYYDRNPDIELLALILDSEQLEQPVYQNQLWRLFNYYPANRWICEYLLWYLLGLNSRQQAQVAIERIERRSKKTPLWLLPYQAILQLLDQHPDTAYDTLKQAVKSLPRWDTFYNLSLAESQLKRYQQAYQSLKQGWMLQPQRPGLFLRLAEQLALDIDLKEEWYNDWQPSPPTDETDPLLDLMKGLHNDYTKNSSTDSNTSPIG